MNNIIGVQFQKNGKLYYFDSNGIELKTGDYVVAETSRGNDLGEVVLLTGEMAQISENETLNKVVRLASEQDIQHGRECRMKEREAYNICQKKISEHQLEMKLVSVEYAFDGSKVIFYFTANGRVDFRSLVKDLASVFKMRIELRQIGVRDEAKMLGGLGPCGRLICCGSFLAQFQPVSIKMAKEQNLSLNPTKISGVCGRLMCCLKYEQDHYEQTRKRMPRVGKIVSTPDGTGPVTELNIVKETVFVRLSDGDTSEIKEYPLESVTRPAETEKAERAEKAESAERHTPEADFTGGSAEQEKEEVPTEAKSELKERTVFRKKERAEKPEKPEKESTGEESGRPGRNRNQARNRQLGQPVRRENPKRSETANGKEDKPGEAEKPGEAGASQPKKGNATSWADAVQNAMRAIDKKE